MSESAAPTLSTSHPSPGPLNPHHWNPTTSPPAGYFGQFGKLTKVRLSRNKKTTKPKHYAFLQFQHAEVARIAAEAMDGYFLFTQKLCCHVMKPEDVHPLLFKGANMRFRNIPWRTLERRRHDKERTPEEHAKRVAKLIKKDAKRRKAIQVAGIDFEYEGLEALRPTKGKRTTFEME